MPTTPQAIELEAGSSTMDKLQPIPDIEQLPAPSLNAQTPTTTTPHLTPRNSEQEIVQIVEKTRSNVVDWDGEDDEENPFNWPGSRKWVITGIVSAMTFTTPLASSMFAPGLPTAMSEFHTPDNTFLSTFTLSIFVLGFAIGPLLVAPLSEIHGRKPLYLLSNALFVAFTIACAKATSLPMLIAFRFLAGCAGSTPTFLGGATIGDMFREKERGRAMAVWGLGPLIGPAVGPVVGGFLTEKMGWRWDFWVQACIGGGTLVLGVIFLRETYPILLLQRKTNTRIKETGNTNLTSALADGVDPWKRLQQAIIRPTKLLFFSPMVFLLSLWMALLFGYLYLFLTTFPSVFGPGGIYNFSTGSTGLTYLGIGIGCLVGLLFMGITADPLHRRLIARNGGVSKPEFRLPPMLLTCPLIGAAFFWFGWSAKEDVFWFVPVLATAVFGVGMIPTFIVTTLYLIDIYAPQGHGASALAANKVLQSLGGAFFPLAGPPLFNRLGLGWGNSVLAFLALAFIPVPWVFFKYGERIRGWERRRQEKGGLAVRG